MTLNGSPWILDTIQNSTSDYDNSNHSTKRSATISDFPAFLSGTAEAEGKETADDIAVNPFPKLTKVNLFKVTRTHSLNQLALSPPNIGKLLDPDHPQSNSTTKEKGQQSSKKVTVDDDAQVSLSGLANSFDNSLPNYYLYSEPSGLNQVGLSSSTQYSVKIDEQNLPENDALTKSRASTVIFTKKRSTESDFHLNEISPINDGMPYTKKSPFDRIIKEDDESSQVVGSSGNESGSTVLHSFNAGRVFKSIFQEDSFNQDMMRKSEAAVIKSTSSSSDEKRESPPSSSNSSFPREQPIYTVKRSVAIVVVLIGVILILLASFIPAIVVLSRGTKEVITRYFSNADNLPLLNELSQKYLPNNILYYPALSIPRINSVEGLKEAIRSDKEIINLMAHTPAMLIPGVTYAPNGSLEPNCTFNTREAMLDLAKLSTITTRIRTYGNQCNQTEILLDAIQMMNLNMTIAMGVWISDDNQSNKKQMDTMKKIISRLHNPRKFINAIYIGNEVLFRQQKTKRELIEYIQDAKDFLTMLHIDNIPVGTAEVGSLIDAELVGVCDVVGANIQPFFAGIPVEESAIWVWQFLKYQLEPIVNQSTTQIVITEVGWPSGGGRYGKAVASKASSKFFICDFVCNFGDKGVDYYLFEAFDEPWKEIFNEGNHRWENQWGIFNADRLNKFPIQNIGCS